MPNKPTLVKAVTDLLKLEYIPNNVKFSAHDVTARLRELVLQQAVIGAVYPIDLAEVGTVFVQGNKVARIAHDDVKQIVHELFDAGEFPAYTREDNGTFFEYEPMADPVAFHGSLYGVTTGRLSSSQPNISVDPKTDEPAPIGPSTGPWSVIP